MLVLESPRTFTHPPFPSPLHPSPKIKTKQERLPEVPIIAVSATATHHVQGDIISQLRLSDPLIIRSSINRPNLHYTIKTKSPSSSISGAMDDLRSILLHPSSSSSGGSAIVYVPTKAEAEDLAKHLTQKLGITAAAYHGGMTEAARRETYNKWSRDEARVVCATVVSICLFMFSLFCCLFLGIGLTPFSHLYPSLLPPLPLNKAFGMGVDKPDVRTVVCYGLTKSLEGKEGRDGRRRGRGGA